MLKFSGNDSGVRILIAAIVLAFIAAGAGWCAKAEAQENRTTVSLGAVLFGSDVCEFQSLNISRELGAGVWLAGLTVHGRGECRGELVDANLGLSIIHYNYFGAARRWAVGIGGMAFEHGDIGIGPELILNRQPPRKSAGVQLAAVLAFRGFFLDRQLVIDFPLHASSGGSTRFNPGKNFFQIGYRF